MTAGEHRATRRVVLFLVASCYFAAFSSLHAQYPGLLDLAASSPSMLFCRGDHKHRSFLKERTCPPHGALGHEPLGVSVDVGGGRMPDRRHARGLFRWSALGPGAGVLALISMFGLYLSLFAVGRRSVAPVGHPVTRGRISVRVVVSAFTSDVETRLRRCGVALEVRAL